MNIDHNQLLMLQAGQRAKRAADSIRLASNDQKNHALVAMARCITANAERIMEANRQDVTNANDAGKSKATIDRLVLTPERIEGIVESLYKVSTLPDPVGRTLAEWERPNGLKFKRVSTPLGVIGVIYESRPNVTADAAGLCLKSGNAVILRGGSDSFFSSREIYKNLVRGLLEAELDEDTIQFVDTVDRSAVGWLLSGLNGCVDVIVPRGGRSLVERVQREARVPVFAHLDGICHVYIHEEADQDTAVDVTFNSKMRRPGICGAAETLLIDRSILESSGLAAIKKLHKAGCEIRGDQEICQTFPDAVEATDQDWHTEYLAPIISARVVNDLSEAVEHIRQFSSGHTESILTQSVAASQEFLNVVDSAIVLVNASTQFADGGEFGMGAEIGIATGKMHARGPVGVEQLTSFNYRVFGTGQVRR